MTPLGWVQLALALLKFANWAASKVDQAQWKRMGYLEAVSEQTAAISRAIGIRTETEAETRGMTPEDVIRDLDGNHELRD